MSRVVLRVMRDVVAVSGAALILGGVFPIGAWLAGPLVVSEPLRVADAIVVVAGGVVDRETLSPSSAHRLLRGLALLRQGYAPLMILTGGNRIDTTAPEAEVMASVARTLGVPTTALLVEREAAWTSAQALAVARLASGRGIRRILLVTSPTHSYRAVRTFRKVGLEVVSAPTATAPRASLALRPLDVLARAGGLSPIVHEYAAIAMYWWKGWI